MEDPPLWSLAGGADLPAGLPSLRPNGAASRRHGGTRRQHVDRSAVSVPSGFPL